MENIKLREDFDSSASIFLGKLINEYNSNLTHIISFSNKDYEHYNKFLITLLISNKIISDSLPNIYNTSILELNLPKLFKDRIKEEYIIEKGNIDYLAEINKNDSFGEHLQFFLNKQNEKYGKELELQYGYDRDNDISQTSYKEIINMASKYDLKTAIEKINTIATGRVQQDDLEDKKFDFLNIKQILILFEYTYLRNKYSLLELDEIKTNYK